jgi:hypothetical protein
MLASWNYCSEINGEVKYELLMGVILPRYFQFQVIADFAAARLHLFISTAYRLVLGLHPMYALG